MSQELSAAHQPLTEGLRFLRLWARNPIHVGAIAPSSRELARAMARQIDVARPGAVIELGGGTGSITAALLKAGVRPADLVVIEREPALCATLSRKFPGTTVIRGDARDLAKLLRDAGVDRINAVVSSLPLLSLPRGVGRRIIDQAISVLPEDGMLIQFTYGLLSPVSRRQRRSLALKADRAAWILQNLPPASIWRYRKLSQDVELRAAA